jgi:hypothetical protein
LGQADYDAVEKLQHHGKELFTGLQNATTLAETRALLSAYIKDMITLLGQEVKDAGSDNYFAFGELAFGAALESVGGARLTGKLGAPGSDFLLALREAYTGIDERILPLSMLVTPFVMRLTALNPNHPYLKHFEIPPDLNLMPYSRRPEMYRKDTSSIVTEADLGEVRSVWRESVEASIQHMGFYMNESKGIPYPPGSSDPNSQDWALSHQFTIDLNRSSLAVDGQKITSTDAFITAFADRRTATLLSRVLHQGMGGAFIDTAPEPIAREMAIVFSQPHIMAEKKADAPQSGSITSLGDGTFRVRYEFGKVVRDLADVPQSADGLVPSDFFADISFTIRLEGSQFTISDPDVDVLILGK